MGKRDHQRPVINLVSRPACTRVVGLCLANASVRYRQFPTERDIQQTSRHADSSGHRNTMRASVRLQTQGGPDNVSSWMSSTHRVLTATLCNESKRASLDQRPLKLLKNNEQATEPSKPLLCRLGSLLTSTGDPRFRQQRRSQDLSQRSWASVLGRPPGLSRRWRRRRWWPQRHRPRPCKLFAFFLVGWPADTTSRLHSAGMGSDTGRVPGVELRPRHNTRHGQQDARSHVTKFPLGNRLPPGLEAPGAGSLPPTNAQGAGAAGGALACRTQSKTLVSLLLPALRDVHATIGRTGVARLPAPSANQRNSWSRTPASRWTWHANSSCFPFCNCSKTHEANDSSSFPSRTRRRQRKGKTR